MMTGSGPIAFDEAMSRQLEAIYGTADVLRRRRLVHEALAVRAGERVLDMGCGPGFYVAELLEMVGPHGALVGIDASGPMLALAARRTHGHGNVAFHQADALALPVDDASFDAALSVQVLEYVTDVPAALAELRRALRVGGRLLVWDVDWSTVSWYSSDATRMQRVLRAFDEHLADPALPRTLAAKLRSAGFDDIRVEGHPFVATALTPDTYAGALLSLVERFVPGRGGVTGQEATAWADDQRDLGDRGEFFCAFLQFCATATRSR